MSRQLLSKDIPLPSSGAISDGTPVYSSFERFKPGLQLLSNDPSAEEGRHVRWHQQRRQRQQQEQQQQQEQKQTGTIRCGTTPKGGKTDSGDPCFDDSDFVDPAGKATVMNATSPGSASAPSAPPTSVASVISEQDAPPVQQHHDPSQAACLPPLSAAFSPPSITPQNTAGSGSGSAQPRTEDEIKEANELGYEDKLMDWWPSPEADELKVERL